MARAAPQAIEPLFALVSPRTNRLSVAMSMFHAGDHLTRRLTAPVADRRGRDPGIAAPHAQDGVASLRGQRAGDERVIDDVRVCWCPPGRFIMGSPRNEPERRPGEDQVEVSLTRGFWMAKYETTQGQWMRAVVGLPGPLTLELPRGDDYPVGNVNFAECEAFCAEMTARARRSGELPAGWEFRLPTEAQWEYACRAGTTTATSFGESLSSTQANFRGTPTTAERRGRPQAGGQGRAISRTRGASTARQCLRVVSRLVSRQVAGRRRSRFMMRRTPPRAVRTGTSRSRRAGAGRTRGALRIRSASVSNLNADTTISIERHRATLNRETSAESPFVVASQGAKSRHRAHTGHGFTTRPSRSNRRTPAKFRTTHGSRRIALAGGA